MAEPDVAPDWRHAPRTLEMPMVAAAFDRDLGSAVHAALRAWQRAVDGGAAPSADTLLAAIRAEATRRSLDPAHLTRGLASLEPHLRTYAAGPWPKRTTLFLEQPVRHLLTGGDGFAVELELRVDRVARYRRGIAIVDYKTVSPHAFARRADEWQLRTYALAAPELVGVPPESVALFILDLGAGAEYEVTTDAAAMAATRTELLACARGIAAGDFGVEGHPDRPCWSCGFRLTCPRSLATDPPRPR